MSGSEYYEGSIDEITVFSSLLSDGEIELLEDNYRAGRNYTGNARDIDDCEPVSYWAFDECHWYTPPAMQVENDITLALNATAYNDMSTFSAQVCNGARFDGQDDWLCTDKTSVLAGKRAMSVSYYVRFDSLGSNTSQSIIVMGDSSDSNLDPSFFMDYVEDELRAFVYTDNTNYYSAKLRWLPNPGEWYNISMTFYRDRPEPIHIYLDGVRKTAVNEETGTFTVIREIPNRIFMGRYRPSVPRWLKGGLDEVRIFDYTLIPEEVSNLMNEYHECENDCGNVELLVYYKFDECSYIGQEAEIKDNANVINLHASLGENANCYPDTGKVCRRIVFDGDEDFIITNPSDFLAGRDEMTVSFWAKFDRFDVDHHIIKQFDYNEDVYDIFELYYQASDSSLQFWVYDSYLYIKKYAYIGWKGKIGQWYHIAAVYDGKEENILSLYLNGQKLNGSDLNTNNSIPALADHQSHLVIGKGRSDVVGSDNYFWGALDELRIYGTALTSNQILDVYNDVLGDCAVCGSAGLPPKTAEWKFNSCNYDGSVDEVRDQTLNYLHGQSADVNPQLEKSKICRAAEFNGNAYISIPHDSLFNFSRTMSISLWVYLENSASVRTLIAKNDPYYSGFRLAVDSDDTVIWQTNGQVWDTGISLEENRWNHLAVTFSMDPLKRYLYVNGQFAAINSPSDTEIQSNSMPITLGALAEESVGGYSYSEYLNGFLDDVAVFSFPLNEDHVQDIFKDTTEICFACEGDTVSSSTVLPMDTWRLVGVPSITENADPVAVLGDDLDSTIPSDTSLTWNIIAYTTQDSTYSYYSEDPGGFPEMVPGRGFIVAQHLQDNAVLSLTGEAVITPFGYKLEPRENSSLSGMNLLANPFESKLRWSDVRLTRDGDTLSIAEASSVPYNWVNAYAYVWDWRNNQYQPIDPLIDSWYDRDTISTWEGFWVINYSTASPEMKIVFDRENFSKNSAAESAMKLDPEGNGYSSYDRFEAASPSYEWVGMLSAASTDGKYSFKNLRFGSDKLAVDSHDGRDALYFEPNSDRYISAYFMDRGPRLQYDLRSASSSETNWKLHLVNEKTERSKYVLRLNNSSSLPGNIQLQLLDESGEKLLLPDLSGTHQLDLDLPDNSSRSYVLKSVKVPDNLVAPGSAALLPVPFLRNTFDLYIFPGELLEDLKVEVNGRLYSPELIDKLYNVYRKRIPLPLKSVYELITISLDLSANVRADTTRFNFLSSSTLEQTRLLSTDAVCILEIPGKPLSEAGIGTGTLPLSVSETPAAAYSVHPMTALLPQGSRLIFPGPKTDDWGEALNSTAVHRLTNGEWIPVETRYDTDRNMIYSPIDKPGIFRLMKNQSVQQILPDKTTLSPNYPNPFNAVTHIRFTLAEPGHVNLTVYNILGERIRILNSAFMTAGTYSSQWTGLTDDGKTAGSGVYFLVLENGHNRLSQKILLLK